MTRWVKTVDSRQQGRHGVEVWRDDYVGVALTRTEQPKLEKLGRMTITRPDEETVLFAGEMHSGDKGVLKFNSLGELTAHISAASSLKTFWEEQLAKDRQEQRNRSHGH